MVQELADRLAGITVAPGRPVRGSFSIANFVRDLKSKVCTPFKSPN